MFGALESPKNPVDFQVNFFEADGNATNGCERSCPQVVRCGRCKQTRRFKRVKNGGKKGIARHSMYGIYTIIFLHLVILFYGKCR